ncbi:MAG: sigma-54-dependent Fis family transcriptional regulator [Deltaproteobacteria bacterium]|nr:sigma-54-dependent Fis family transcriptional regulator [Deltaproteobacteria bacterium]
MFLPWPRRRYTARVASAFPPSNAAARILVVDDEPGLREMVSILLRREGFNVTAAPGFARAKEAIASSPAPFALVLTDMVMPDGSGLELLTAAKERNSATEVIVMTAHSTVEAALDAMRRGAYDFVAKPFQTAELRLLVGRALEKSAIVRENALLRAQLAEARPEDPLDLLGKSAPMRAIADLIRRVAPSRTTVLVTGESGTGKERIARAFHSCSDRASKPFLVVNCGALPENLMESELFGHERGAFTGAAVRHLGLFREADGGTLLLDEIGELPLNLQVKLLRVLQERKVRPVGATAEIPIDVRLIAATNRDVEKDVAEGRFRQDLYYRLNIIRVEVPPLRARTEDIPMLVDHFVQRFAGEHGKSLRGLMPEAMRAVLAYPFPGNVRELENAIERAVTLSTGPLVGLGDLPPSIAGVVAAPAPRLLDLPPEGCELDAVVAEVERRLILQALERTNGVRTQAAKLLGITFRSLRYRLDKLGLALPDSGEEPDAEDEGGRVPSREVGKG